MHVRSILTLTLFLWLFHAGGLWLKDQVIYTAPLPEQLAPPDDHESLFALGIKIPLSQADLIDLGMIEGVGDRLGQRILDKGEKIQALAITLEPFERWRAFTIVYGVGENTARKISEHFAPER